MCPKRRLTVVVPWVSDVVLQAVDGALAAHCCLAAEAHERKHGQTAVLELVELGLLAPHAHRVEGEGAQHAGLQGAGSRRRQSAQHSTAQEARQLRGSSHIPTLKTHLRDSLLPHRRDNEGVAYRLHQLLVVDMLLHVHKDDANQSGCQHAPSCQRFSNITIPWGAFGAHKWQAAHLRCLSYECAKCGQHLVSTGFSGSAVKTAEKRQSMPFPARSCFVLAVLPKCSTPAIATGSSNGIIAS